MHKHMFMRMSVKGWGGTPVLLCFCIWILAISVWQPIFQHWSKETSSHGQGWNIILVGGWALPLWKIWVRQLGLLFPTEWKNKKCSKLPTSIYRHTWNFETNQLMSANKLRLRPAISAPLSRSQHGSTQLSSPSMIWCDIATKCSCCSCCSMHYLALAALTTTSRL